MSLQVGEEEVGELWQDQENMAALLLYRQQGSSHYSMVSILTNTLENSTRTRLHGEDNIAIKRYVISFWNGVDLRYKLLHGPSVKISIAGIIISRVRPTHL